MLYKGININNSINIGLKLWSVNGNYVDEAAKLFENGYFKYIELFIVPGSYNQFVNLWKNLKIPFIIHAPHYREGMNLANNEVKAKNFRLAEETRKFADDLRSEIIIFHPGVNGSTNETARQLRELNEPRIIIENKPYLGLDNDLVCNGYSPEEIKFIMNYSDVGFCMDIGHAICASNALKVKTDKLLNEFIDLKPIMFHLSDGYSDGVYDNHLHLGEGNYNINYLLNLLPENAIISLETVKNSFENLDDFVGDVEFLNNNFRKIKLATISDIDEIYNLSNDKTVRNNSFNKDEIIYENHVKWFHEKINSLDSVYYIIRNIDKELISQVRLDKDVSNEWIISISIAEKFRGKGLSSKILTETINIFRNSNSNNVIYAFIKKNNELSVKSFIKADFTIISEVNINNLDSYKLKFNN